MTQPLKVVCVTKLLGVTIRSDLTFSSHVAEITKKMLLFHFRDIFAIILQADFRSYNRALERLGQDRLSVRRTAAALKFGEKCLQNPKHSDMFPRSLQGRLNLRGQRVPFQEQLCRTDRLSDSSIPAITRLLNEKYRVE